MAVALWCSKWTDGWSDNPHLGRKKSAQINKMAEAVRDETYERKSPLSKDFGNFPKSFQTNDPISENVCHPPA